MKPDRGRAPPKTKATGDEPEAFANHSPNTTKRISGRPENQGIAPARNPSQPAPRWKQPPESAALRRLEALFVGPPRTPIIKYVSRRRRGRGS